MKVSNQQQPPVEHIEMFSTLKTILGWSILYASGMILTAQAFSSMI